MAGILWDRWRQISGCCIALVGALVGLLVMVGHAQSKEVFTLTADRLQNGQAVELDKLGWKYSPNDDPQFAEPQFDDRAWETIPNTAFDLDHLPNSGWQGIGWFRLRLRVDEATAKEPLCLLLEHWGASEIWLDGRLLQSFGKVGATTQTEVELNPRKAEAMPVAFVLEGGREHLLAIRHSCAALHANPRPLGRTRSGNMDEMQTRGREAGLRVALTQMTTVTTNRDEERFAPLVFVTGVGALYGVLGLFNLLLFAFYPPQRASLWFGLNALCWTAIMIVNLISMRTNPGLVDNQYLTFYFLLGTSLSTVFLLGFLYTVFGEGIGRKFWAIAVLTIAFRLAPFFFPDAWFFSWLNPVLLLALIFEFVRVVVRAIGRKVSGSLYVGIPLLLSLGFPLNEALQNFGINLNQDIVNFLFGAPTTLLATIAISTFLARQFARTNVHLEEQLLQVKQLSTAALEHEKVKAENERRAAELEEARQLQLSMLPKKLPNLPHLDLAAYMKTASEVGGDYYDFHLGDDGTLTIAVGDATGHGLKAGTMVSVVKSLFVSLAYHPDIPHIFARKSRVLKEMKLRGLFMALTMVKVMGQQMSFSMAGMPPILLYRAAAGTVEEVLLKALPLGGVAGYQYRQQEINLAAGDVVVLMSDGLPERFNAQGEMLEYAPIHTALLSVAQESSQTIIERLVQLGDEWGGARMQDDDVTFVVVKMK